MFSCFTKVFQTHNIVVDPEFQAALHESSTLIKEQQKIIGTFIDKIGGLKAEMEALRRENAEVREQMRDLSGKISTVIVEVFEEMEQEKKAGELEPRASPPTIQTSTQESPLDLIRVPAKSSPNDDSLLMSQQIAADLWSAKRVVAPVIEEVEEVEATIAEAAIAEATNVEESKEDYQELPEEVAEEELIADPEPVVPEPTVTKKGRGGSRSKKK